MLAVRGGPICILKHTCSNSHACCSSFGEDALPTVFSDWPESWRNGTAYDRHSGFVLLHCWAWDHSRMRFPACLHLQPHSKTICNSCGCLLADPGPLAFDTADYVWSCFGYCPAAIFWWETSTCRGGEDCHVKVLLVLTGMTHFEIQVSLLCIDFAWEGMLHEVSIFLTHHHAFMNGVCCHCQDHRKLEIWITRQRSEAYLSPWW